MTGPTSERQRGTVEVLEAGRALAALAVVLFHANAVMGLPKYYGREWAMFSAGDSGVEFFFVLSGFVMVLAHGRQFGMAGASLTFLWKRFRRIYLPLWPVLCLVLAAEVFLFGRAAESLDWKAVAAAFLITPVREEALLAVEWTLRHEVLFYALFAFALWRPRLGLPALWLWCAASALSLFWKLEYPLSFLASPYHALFGMGMLAAWATERASVPAPRLLATCGLLLFAGMWGLVAFGDVPRRLPFVIWGFGLGAMASLVGLIALERAGLRPPKMLTILGAASYSIYLIHFPALSAFAKIGVTLGLPAPLWFVLSVVGACLAGLAFHLAVERPLLRALPCQTPTVVACACSSSVTPGTASHE